MLRMRSGARDARPAAGIGGSVHYRLYRLKPETGAIVSARDLDVPGDREAIAAAHDLHGAEGEAFELWCGTRRVAEHRVATGKPAESGGPSPGRIPAVPKPG